MVDDLLWGALLHDVAAFHEDHPGGDLTGKADFVGDYHHGHAVGGKLLHDRQHLADHFRIQGGSGLVEEQNVRVHSQRPGDGHPLLLTAGQLGRKGRGFVQQPHSLQKL